MPQDAEYIWVLLRVFYSGEPVDITTLSKEEMRMIENFSHIGGIKHFFSFTQRKAYVKLTRSGKSYLYAFISGASYFQQ